MAFQKVGSVSALPPGTLRPAQIGETEIAICNVAGEIHAVEGRCPHAGGPIGQGALHGTTLVCPWHAWEFDCITGEFDRYPGLKLALYEVKIEGDDILVNLP